MASDTAKALAYVHGVSYNDLKTHKKVDGIVHRDIKPDNCLVTATYGIKIVRFVGERASGRRQAFSASEGSIIKMPVCGGSWCGEASTIEMFSAAEAGTRRVGEGASATETCPFAVEAVIKGVAGGKPPEPPLPPASSHMRSLRTCAR
jgi:serine/threonine protein kinase